MQRALFPSLLARSPVFNYNMKWTDFIRRIHAIALEETMAVLLQGNQEASMLRKHLCAPYFVISSPFISYWLSRNELNVRNTKIRAILLQMLNWYSPMH